MALDLNNILVLAIIFQSLLLSLFFFQNKKGNILSNRILGTFISVIAVTMVFSFTTYNRLGNTLLVDKYPVFYITVEFHYLLGPLLYFYIKSLIDRNFKIQWVHLIHFIPFFILISYISISLLFLYYSNLQMVIINQLRTIHFRETDIVTMIFHMISYNFACVILVVRGKNSDNSFLKDLQSSWLKFLIPFCTGILLLKAFTYIVFLSTSFYQIMSFSNIAYFILLFIFIYWITFYTLKNPETFSFSKKYRGSDLNNFDIEEIREKLICYIEESKIYLEPSLTITMLSKKLSLSVHQLSRIINESLNLNFCDFINRYRIEESKKHLIDLPGSKKTILEIAYTVGFNSKSSFYQAFKRQTGISPTEFIKQSAGN